ncbi:MAG: ABC transporter ATP-binding protein [Clostridia bacterium]|nr:ABC transporter ATP-binding protein [Clostridia bacterium]MBQ4291095.1 ABC transporter ATP-binding protein [Clostridia bacterium]
MIEVKHLTKRYGNNTAVDDISFSVKPGMIYGFLGPNGAGKSTTMNIITGCLAATEGTVTINGHDVFEEPLEAKKHVGYLPELPPLYAEMTPAEYLRFVAEAKGVSKEEMDYQLSYVMEKTQITSMQDRLIKNLSKGYRQRVGVAQAMLGNPEVIILDEPTVGLDPGQIIEIRDLIKSLADEHHTVILSSHILSEVSAVCDYVMIISHGRLIASDTIDNLSTILVGSRVLHLTVKGDLNRIRQVINRLADQAKTIRYEESSEDRGIDVYDIDIEVEKDIDLRETAFRLFCDAKCVILKLYAETIGLEDVFLKLTREYDEQYRVEQRLAALDQEENAFAPKEDDRPADDSGDNDPRPVM